MAFLNQLSKKYPGLINKTGIDFCYLVGSSIMGSFFFWR